MELNEDSGHLGLTNHADEASSAILSVEKLRQLSRSLPTLVPYGGHANEQPSALVQQLRLDLLHTAKSSHLSLSHGTAALNALCAFLDFCSKCRNDAWSSLCFSSSTCEDLLHILLDRSEIHKTKPSRQLLLTLTNLLAKYPNGDMRLLLIDFVVARCVRLLSKHDSVKSMKPCIQALEHLMKRGIITATTIIAASKGDAQAPQTISEHAHTAFREDVEHFIMYVLDWVRYPDCASAISRFLPCFFVSLDACLFARDPRDQSTKYASKTPFWIRPVRSSLTRNIDILDRFEHHVLPGLLRLSSWDRESFLATLPFDELQQGNVGDQTEADIQLCLLTAKVIKSCLENQDDEARRMLKIENVDLNQICMNLVGHSVANIRIAAFSLMISSSKSTTPLPSDGLVHIQQCVSKFQYETNPKIRNEFVAMMKLLCVRLENAAKVFSRSFIAAGKAKQDFGEAGENLMQHMDFARWYQQYLWHELRPTAPYQSHITALRILSLIFSNPTLPGLVFPNHQSPFKAEQPEHKSGGKNILNQVRPLLDLFTNPFNDVRQSASEVLCLILPLTLFSGWMYMSNDNVDVRLRTNQATQAKIVRWVELALAHAEKHLCRSGRADHADGVGHLYNLYYGISKTGFYPASSKKKDPFDSLLAALEKSLKILGQGLPCDELVSTPLHGHLIALRHIVHHVGFAKSRQASAENSDMQSLYTRLLACCSQSWCVVRHTLCYDAPEGFHAPDVGDEDEDVELDRKSKDTLSFCWRALKEASNSLLMRAIVDQISSPGGTSSSGLHDRDYSIYGQLIFTQLVELRHRGAFSTVAETFAAWCVMCSKSKFVHVSGLPSVWYQQSLACIQQKATAVTRRSAGIPAVITGILAAYASSSFFDDVVLDLQAIADTPTEGLQDTLEMKLPQVHAINCLKDIFTDSRFGTSTEGHIEISLGIALANLESDIWAMRNCGLMLLKALLKRLNGGTDTMSTRVASLRRQKSPMTYERFPILPELLLKLLHHQDYETSPTLHAQRVFPALEIVERFGVPNVHREEVWRALMHHRASPIWLVRQKAAKTIGMIVENDELLEEVWRIVHASDAQTQNEVHGRLMTLRVLIARAVPTYLDASKVGKHLDETFALLFKIHDTYIVDSICPITVAAALNLISDVVERILDIKDDLELRENFTRLRYLLQVKQAKHHLYSSPSDSAYALESDVLSRCLCCIDHVLAIGSHRAAKNLANDSVRSDSALHDPLDALHNDAVAPHQSDERLQQWGGQAAEVFLDARGTTVHFMRWNRFLLLAMSPYSELSTRLAAVKSVDLFCLRLCQHKSDRTAIEIPLELLTILYDTLVDDDEDVRDHGAKVVSSLLSSSASKSAYTCTRATLSPCSAKSRLSQYLSSTYSRSATLILEAVCRLIGTAEIIDAGPRTELLHIVKRGVPVEINAANLRLTPVSVLLERAMQEQNVVFEEEKPNLYLDPVTEAETWAKIILNIKTEAWLPGLPATLRVWTESGLLCLLHALDEYVEGPLGLTSRADVHALFMQVVLMTRVLILSFSDCLAGRQGIEEEFQICNMTTSLKHLWKRGQEKDMHPLILDRIQRVLQEIGDFVD